MDVERIIRTLPGLTLVQRSALRGNAVRLSETGTPQQKADARRVLDGLEALERGEQAGLDIRDDAQNAARVVRAFQAVPMTETEERLLQVLLDNPGSTSSHLSAALGWGGQAWHLHFGTMCFRRAAYLWPAPPNDHDGNFYSGILADFHGEGSRFTMKPAVAAALATMGLRARVA